MMAAHLVDSSRLPSCCGRGCTPNMPVHPFIRHASLHGSSSSVISNKVMRHHLSMLSTVRPVSHSRAAALGSMQQMTSQSVDPMASKPGSSYTSGQVFTVHSKEELDSFTQQEKLTVLMCKSSHCRPCKMFTRKYNQLAQRFPDSMLLDIIGDESPDTRRLMMDSEVKVTPTFRLYRGSECVATLLGTNEKKLRTAIAEHLMPMEAGFGMQATVDEDDVPPAQPGPTPAAVPSPQASKADVPESKQQQQSSSSTEAAASLISSIAPRLTDTAVKMVRDVAASADVVS